MTLAPSMTPGPAGGSRSTPRVPPRPLRLRRIFDAQAALEDAPHPIQAAVFETVAGELIEGPRPLPFVRIQALTHLPTSALDACLSQLRRKGLLTVIREADPARHRCRVWSLGPAILQAGDLR